MTFRLWYRLPPEKRGERATIRIEGGPGRTSVRVLLLRLLGKDERPPERADGEEDGIAGDGE